MLPNTEDCPSGTNQLEVGISIPVEVPLDLLRPVPAIGSVLTAAVIDAPVPETAIDEDRHLHPREDDVSLAS